MVMSLYLIKQLPIDSVALILICNPYQESNKSKLTDKMRLNYSISTFDYRQATHIQ